VSETYHFVIETALRASAARVWDHASSMAGVNRELWPLVQMTYPPTMKRLTPETVPLRRRAFRSWLLLFGLLPIEYDDLTLIELEPGRGFLEVSRLFSMREWRHRRTVLPTAEGCILRDEVDCTPRWPWSGPFLVPLFRFVFALRHRALRRLFSRPCSGPWRAGP